MTEKRTKAIVYRVFILAKYEIKLLNQINELVSMYGASKLELFSRKRFSRAESTLGLDQWLYHFTLFGENFCTRPWFCPVLLVIHLIAIGTNVCRAIGIEVQFSQ